MDLTQLSDQELEDLSGKVRDEQYRRSAVNNIPEQMKNLNEELLNAKGRGMGQPWVQPEGAHDAYPVGWVVKHSGKVWTNTLLSNVWEPGVTGWQERVEEGQVPEWVQPTGAHDAYSANTKVKYNDKTWRSTMNGNVWEPGVYGWKEI